MGDREIVTPVIMESPLKYHPLGIWDLTSQEGHRLVGSLTGVVASKSVTEASQGPLSADGNRPERVRARRELDCEADTPSRDESRA